MPGNACLINKKHNTLLVYYHVISRGHAQIDVKKLKHKTILMILIIIPHCHLNMETQYIQFVKETNDRNSVFPVFISSNNFP